MKGCFYMKNLSAEVWNSLISELEGPSRKGEKIRLIQHDDNGLTFTGDIHHFDYGGLCTCPAERLASRESIQTRAVPADGGRHFVLRSIPRYLPHSLRFATGRAKDPTISR